MRQRVKTSLPFRPSVYAVRALLKASSLCVTVKVPVVLNELRQRHRTETIDVDASVQGSWQLRQNLIAFPLRIVQMTVNHITTLYIHKRIVAERDMKRTVINFKEVRNRFKIIKQAFLVFYASIVIAADQVFVAP